MVSGHPVFVFLEHDEERRIEAGPRRLRLRAAYAAPRGEPFPDEETIVVLARDDAGGHRREPAQPARRGCRSSTACSRSWKAERTAELLPRPIAVALADGQLAGRPGRPGNRCGSNAASGGRTSAAPAGHQVGRDRCDRAGDGRGGGAAGPLDGEVVGGQASAAGGRRADRRRRPASRWRCGHPGDAAVGRCRRRQNDAAAIPTPSTSNGSSLSNPSFISTRIRWVSSAGYLDLLETMF